VLVGRSIQELCELMVALPDYASHFVNMICRILQEYLDSCQQAYHGSISLTECVSSSLITVQSVCGRDCVVVCRILQEYLDSCQQAYHGSISLTDQYVCVSSVDYGRAAVHSSL